MITLSFIIPTLNEGLVIGGTIDRIVEATANKWIREIIVVDNGSTDQTVNIAQKKNAKVLFSSGRTIAAVRNVGAGEAQGDIIVFLDADVLLTQEWSEGIEQVAQYLMKDPMILTGSICRIDENASWIERNWFDPSLRRQLPKYINSGHLILNRQLFNLIGGFDHMMETGEDVDFCMRATHLGARVVHNPQLKVIHLGYPKRVSNFIRRERWHGRGDYNSAKDTLSSKPALTSLFLLFSLIFALVSAVSSNNYLWILVFVFFAMLVLLMSALHRFGLCKRAFFPGTLIYGIYFGARILSFLDIILSRIKHWSNVSRTNYK